MNMKKDIEQLINKFDLAITIQLNRAKWFGGGVVFQSYNIEDTLHYALNKVKEVKR